MSAINIRILSDIFHYNKYLYVSFVYLQSNIFQNLCLLIILL